ncbi:MAG: anthranilate synthase component I family protein [Phycisphaerales bacterium]
MPAEPVTLKLTPIDALLAWAGDLPLAACVADAEAHDPWTILARPTSAWAWSAPEGWTALGDCQETFALDDADPLDAIDRLVSTSAAAHARSPSEPPFVGGWVLALSYDLGRTIEPAATSGPRARDDRAWPALVLVRTPAAYVYDHTADQWWRVGDPSLLPDLASPTTADARWAMSPPSLDARRAYTRAVARVLDYIRAGDTYQVNLTHRLSAEFNGSTRALAADLFAAARPWHGAFLELDQPHARRAIISASPELFLDADLMTGHVRTRPMKGTRPASADPEELFHAEKDRAELDMIIDLMRNDLGRVCRPGSLSVESPRDIERHASGVLQATATVAGRLREGIGPGSLLRATFPPGSVTGVPKIRAMQIIDELEPATRGPYCGALGFLSDSGRLRLNVAIRTALVTGSPRPTALDEVDNATLDLGVGAGIVADSDPDAEWRESIDKARFLLDLAAARAPLVPAR